MDLSLCYYDKTQKTRHFINSKMFLLVTLENKLSMKAANSYVAKTF